MRIALVSYEYPPDTAFGGIATYIRQAARMLAEAGHDVEVFTGSPTRTASDADEPVAAGGAGPGVRVHRVRTGRGEFPEAVRSGFARRHRDDPFDVVEGPDFGGDAVGIIADFPDLPLVLKLHTPTFVGRIINAGTPTWRNYARGVLGALRRLAPPWWWYARGADVEFHHAQEADRIASPSRAVGRWVGRRWKLDSRRIDYFPYPFVAAESLLALPAAERTRTLGFLGRVVPQKGVFDLVAAMPRIVAALPEVRLRIIGPIDAETIAYARSRAGTAADRIDFVGRVPPEEIAGELAKVDVCVFPSRWESFGFVCLEAMAAGRGVIAGLRGGMAELVGPGPDYEAGVGLLVKAEAGDIAAAVIRLANRPEWLRQFIADGRERVVARYDPSAVLPAQIACYRAAIEQRRRAGPRATSPVARRRESPAESREAVSAGASR